MIRLHAAAPGSVRSQLPGQRRTTPERDYGQRNEGVRLTAAEAAGQDRLAPMRRRHVTLAVSVTALLLAGVAAGCGSEGTKTATPQTVIGKVPKPSTPTTTTSPTRATRRRARTSSLTSAGCARLPHAQGGGRDRARSGRTSTRRSRRVSLILDRVTNGKGVMPSFSGSLSPKQIADVVAFVFQSTHS